MIGKSEEDFQPPEVATRIIDEDERILTTGEFFLNQQGFLMDLVTGKPRWRQTTKVPLRDASGQIIGLVGISRDITKQKETEEALVTVNEKLTQGISSLEKSSRETAQLSEMIDLLQACPNTEEACIGIADQMSKFFPYDSGSLYLYNTSRKILDRSVAWGRPCEESMILKPEDCWGLRRGKMHIVQGGDVSQSSSECNHSLICPHVVATGPADYLCVPLVAQGEAIGLMHLRHQVEETNQENAYLEEWYDQYKRQRIQTITDSLSLALANLKLRSTLREQSIRDPLTGMFNRRYMEETVEREILRAKRNNETIRVIMIDIDHFKLFNDTFGHQAGDALLTALGHLFLSHVRGEDVACRYGGEEFILVMPGAKPEPTLQRAEDLREKVHNIDATFHGQSLGKVTLSMGVANYPANGTTVESLIQRADQALYQAKVEGRDRVVVSI